MAKVLPQPKNKTSANFVICKSVKKLIVSIFQLKRHLDIISSCEADKSVNGSIDSLNGRSFSPLILPNPRNFILHPNTKYWHLNHLYKFTYDVCLFFQRVHYSVFR
jgi:hypothetical protein